MPANEFKPAFFQRVRNLIEPEKLQATLSELYHHNPPYYFSVDKDQDLSEALLNFRKSNQFQLFTRQYLQLVIQLHRWCINHLPSAVIAFDNMTEAAFNKLMSSINRWSENNGGETIHFSAPHSTLKIHVTLLFSEQDFYSTRSAIFFDEGKKALEVLSHLLQDPDVSLDKKRDVMRNLLAGIAACADGALTHVLEAKDEILAIQNAQALFEQSKQAVIRQLAISFHRQTRAAQLPPNLNEIGRREVASIIRAYEVHFGSTYIDTVAESFGLPKRNDLFKLAITTEPNRSGYYFDRLHPDHYAYFPIYVNAEITPAMVIEQWLSQFELLYQALHQEITRLFKQSSLGYTDFQEQVAPTLTRAIERWNQKYGTLYQLDTYTFVDIDESNQVSPLPYDPIQLKAIITKIFEEHYVSSPTYTFKFTSLQLADDVVEFHHGIVWRENADGISRLTPNDFFDLKLPAFNSPEFLPYWMILNHLLLAFPNEHPVLMSAFVNPSPYQSALLDLIRRPYLLARLAQAKQLAVLEFIKQTELRARDIMVLANSSIEENARSIASVFKAYSLNSQSNHETIGKAFRMAAANHRAENLSLLFNVAPYVLDQQDSNPASQKTALHYAIERNHLDIITCLVSFGARIDIPDSKGVTAQALFRALSPLPDNIQLWLYFDVPAKDNTEKNLWLLLDKYRATTLQQKGTAFRRAAHEGTTDEISAFLRADPTLLNQQEDNTKKRTALHLAVINNNVPVVEALLRAGADKEIPNGEGNTAVMLAEQSNNERIKQLFAPPPSPNVPKEILLTQLQNYIQKINSHYESGFMIASRSRSLNRQVNVEIARRLHASLEAERSSEEIGVLFSEAHVNLLRREVIHALKLQNNPHYVERAIGSKSIQDTLALGRHHFPEPDSWAFKKAKLKAALSAYIKRVDGYSAYGFQFFVDARSSSRRVNCALAQRVLELLDTVHTAQDAKAVFNEDTIKKLRNTLAVGITDARTSIRSDELNAALKLGEMLGASGSSVSPCLP